MTKTNTVIPLPLLCKNEKTYADVFDVLDSYEQLIGDFYTKAGIKVDDSTKETSSLESVFSGVDSSLPETFIPESHVKRITPLFRIIWWTDLF